MFSVIINESFREVPTLKKVQLLNIFRYSERNLLPICICNSQLFPSPGNLLHKEKGLTLHDTSSPGIEMKHGCTTYNIGEGEETGSGRRKLQLQAAAQAGWDSVQFKRAGKLKF
jgi:hypothetical protein